MSDNEVALKVRAFLIGDDTGYKDREMAVSSVEIDDGTMWVYLKEQE